MLKEFFSGSNAKKMKPVRPKPGPRRQFRKVRTSIKDPIEVFCRLRPLENINEPCCARPIDSSTVCLSPPDSLVSRNGTVKETHYSFKHVFDDSASQKTVFEYVALPLINDLFDGANGLLFTYGITSSGKTYTMSGTPQNCGLLPRCLDVIFNSIGKSRAASKYVFKPDKFNGFDVQSVAEAMLEQQKELGIFNRATRGRKKEVQDSWNQRIADKTVIDNINEDRNFAVFVSYVEIYNNYIYDLLEEIPDSMKDRPLQSKILREDSMHNMYVFGITEVEVQTAEEALEYYHKGQLRRRVSNTALNTQSSRSHIVFTIRIVQAPLDPQGAEVLQDKTQVSIGQLSLVDLAGSERSVRTGSKGDRLREAGNINASLMALRTCIEILKETQTQGVTKMVPYRESKLTHLFKTFFEGEGKIRMVVCVNPRAEDYDETLHVMKFAEMTQEVLISRPTPIATPVTIGLRSGRGNLYREAIRRVREDGIPLSEALPPTVYSLGPDFPPLFLEFEEDDGVLDNLVSFLSERKNRRASLASDLSSRLNDFRSNLVAIDRDNLGLKQEILRLQMDLEGRGHQLKMLERKLSSAEQANDGLQKRIVECEKINRAQELRIRDSEVQISRGEKEKESLKTQMQSKLAFEKQRMKIVMEKRLAEKQAELEKKMCFTEEKFRQLREILYSDDWEFGNEVFGMFPYENNAPNTGSSSDPPESKLVRSKTAVINSKTKKNPIATVSASKSDTNLSESTRPRTKNVAVANPRHRRSASSNADVWLEHRPVGSLDLGTVLQPKMKKKRSVGKLEVKDIVTKDVSKYVLTHQEQDSAGEMETQLFKADVIPSAGGGAQVIFNDVEKLRQVSPTTQYNLRKRSAEELTLGDIEDRCTVAVECHGKPSKVMRKVK